MREITDRRNWLTQQPFQVGLPIRESYIWWVDLLNTRCHLLYTPKALCDFPHWTISLVLWKKLFKSKVNKWTTAECDRFLYGGLSDWGSSTYNSVIGMCENSLWIEFGSFRGLVVGSTVLPGGHRRTEVPAFPVAVWSKSTIDLGGGRLVAIWEAWRDYILMTSSKPRTMCIPKSLTSSGRLWSPSELSPSELLCF